MKLLTLPDCKKYHPMLVVGKKYKILGQIGNGYIIQPDGCDEQIVVLKTRLA